MDLWEVGHIAAKKGLTFDLNMRLNLDVLRTGKCLFLVGPIL